jgi:uncharacterized protein DUF4920
MLFMRKAIVIFVLAMVGFTAKSQITPSAPGIVYGKVSDEGKPVAVDKLEQNLKENKYEGKVSGKVVEVCRAEGCWLKLEKADGSAMMVRAKNHSFLVPVDLIGKSVVVEGEANVTEVSEEMRKHYAEDAGKTKKEIDKIKGSEKQIVFQAAGVKVL